MWWWLDDVDELSVIVADAALLAGDADADEDEFDEGVE